MNSQNVNQGMSNDRPARGNVFSAVIVLAAVTVAMALSINALYQMF